MEETNQIHQWILFLLPFIIAAAIWEATWKLIAMWRAARNGHLAWFICIAIFNTIAILPIIYLVIHKKPQSIKDYD